MPEHAPLSGPVCTLEGPPSRTADSATIAFRVIGTTRERCALSIVAETLRPWPLASSGPWTVQLTVLPTHATARPLTGEKARDAIDGDATLLATDDVDLVAYAASRADLEVAPLAWDRAYLHLSPAPTGALGAMVSPDAVRVDARQAEPPRCDALIAPGDSPTVPAPAMRVVYDAADRTARELAERVVALAERADVTAVGVQTSRFEAVLQRGTDLAYIVALPRSSYCDALATLSRRAPWLVSGSLTPLIDTRAHAIVLRAQRP